MFMTQLIKEVKKINKIPDPHVVLDRYAVSEEIAENDVDVGDDVVSEESASNVSTSTTSGEHDVDEHHEIVSRKQSKRQLRTRKLINYHE